MSPESALADLRRMGVSATPEMVGQLQAYADILKQWQPRINLISPKTLPDLWIRHILDSAQLAPHIPPMATHITDIGSGAGFPAIVLAILCPQIHFTCVESDTRKCAFLQAAARASGIKIIVQNKRIEQHDWALVDGVTARALASLADLEPYLRAAQGAQPQLFALLLKGARWQDEVAEAPAVSRLFHVEHSISQTSDDGVILLLTSRSSPCA